MSCDLKSGVHVAAATTFLATLLQCAALGCSTLNGPHLSNKHRKQCRFSCKKNIYIYNPTWRSMCDSSNVYVCVETGENEQALINAAADQHLNDMALFYSCCLSASTSKKRN